MFVQIGKALMMFEFLTELLFWQILGAFILGYVFGALNHQKYCRKQYKTEDAEIGISGNPIDELCMPGNDDE